MKHIGLNSRYNRVMPPSYQEVQQLAHELTPEERMMLVNDLLAELEPHTLAEDDPGFEAEIERRVAEIKAGTAETCSLEDLEADFRNILGE